MLMVIWALDRLKDGTQIVQELWPPNPDVLPAPLAELDNTALRVRDRQGELVLAHAVVAAGIADAPRACVKRSASSPAGRAWR